MMTSRNQQRTSFAAAGWVLAVLGAVLCPGLARAQERPNIILILADDLGIGSLGTYGGKVATPHLDALAADGATFNNYYIQPRCSPTRAALLTGHQNQRVGFNVLSGNGVPLDQNHVMLQELLQDEGYDTYLTGKWHLGTTTNFGSLGTIPGNAAVDPRVRGFDHAFTFNDAEHSKANWNIGQYRLLSNDPSLVAPANRYATDTNGDYNRYDAAGAYTPLAGGVTPEFYQTDAIGDYALDFLQHHRNKNTTNGTDNPFFQYVAFGAPHFPIEAPQEVTNRYATVNPDGSVTGVYAAGWDAVRADHLQAMIAKGIVPADLVLSPRGDAYGSPDQDGGKVELIAWADVPASRKPALIRAMAVYSAMVDVVDQNVGRIVDDLKAHGEFDNTLIMFMTDNGANGENDVYGLDTNPQEDDNPPPAFTSVINLQLMGTAIDPDTRDQRLGTAWANAESSPYRMSKRYTHEGGIKSPLIISWPDGLDPSLTTSSTNYDDHNNDVMHVADVTPTILDLLGLDLPETYTALNGTNYDVVDFDSTTVSWADLLTNGTALGDREFGIEHIGNRMYRMGDWKIVSKAFTGNDGDASTPNNTLTAGQNPTLIPANEWELYNLSDDPSELNNLADDPLYAEVFSTLKSKYDLWAFETKVSSTLPNLSSDFNFDGNLDTFDLQIFLDNWLVRHAATGSIDTYVLGDRNVNGINDLGDWALIRQDFANAGLANVFDAAFGLGQVPEPGSLVIVVGMLLGLSRCRRRQRDRKAQR